MIDLNKAWEKADTDKSAKSGEIKDGLYDCTLKDVYIAESKKGNTGVAWVLIDNKSGKEIFRWQNLWSVETQDDEGVVGNSLYWLKKDMAVLGLTCGGFDECHNTLQTMIGATVRIEAKTKNGYSNINIKEKLANPVQSPNSGGDEPPDDDVPF
ncbi:MAG: hypothetical protein FWD31_15195 [Planctomycetaceae bacterium]|nr:hypothetical protein [Planctomycetaceae bacterium]